jgi:hypothetical protein
LLSSCDSCHRSNAGDCGCDGLAWNYEIRITKSETNLNDKVLMA